MNTQTHDPKAFDLVLTAVAQTKQWRKELDEVLQHIRHASDRGYTGSRNPDAVVYASRERAVAIVKAQEAIMWLGMDLKTLGTENPYPHSYDPQSPIIDPTADGLKL